MKILRLRKELRIPISTMSKNEHYDLTLLINEGTICEVVEDLSYGWRIKVNKMGCEFLLNVSREDVFNEEEMLINKGW